jgi:hypothetical protein
MKFRPTSQDGITNIFLYNTHTIVLRTIRTWLNFGIVAGRKNYPSHFGRKPMFAWRCQTTDLSVRLLALLLPYLRVKRSQVEQILGLSVAPEPMSWPYVAAFFDGEGSPVFYESNGHHDHYSFAIIQKNQAILQEIQGLLGYGWVSPHGVNCWRLGIADHEDQLKFIAGVLPHSIVKADKLRQARAFIEGKEWNVRHKLKDVPDQELAECYAKHGSIRRVAKDYGVAYGPMRLKLMRIGVPLRPLGTNQFSSGW